jgi:RNA-binding protein
VSKTLSNLTNPQKRFLMKLGHEIDASIWIGKDGVNDGLIKNTRAALLAHELIKIKVNQNSEEGRDAVVHELANAVGADVVQAIGRTALLYKAHPDKPQLKLPS